MKREVCPVCDGAGVIVCEHCGGECCREEKCGYCDATGWLEVEDE